MYGHRDSYRHKEDAERASFLMEACKYINQTPSRVLKAHMNILCAEVLRMKNFQRHAQYLNKLYCQYCHTPYYAGDFSLKISPVPKKTKKIKKILKKFGKNKIVWKREANIMKHACSGNMVVLTCNVCSGTIEFNLYNKTQEKALAKYNITLPKMGVKNYLKRKLPSSNANVMKNSNCSNSVKKSKSKAKAKENVVSVCDNNGKEGDDDADGDDIEITYEHFPAQKRRRIDGLDNDDGGKEMMDNVDTVPSSPLSVIQIEISDPQSYEAFNGDYEGFGEASFIPLNADVGTSRRRRRRRKKKKKKKKNKNKNRAPDIEIIQESGVNQIPPNNNYSQIVQNNSVKQTGPKKNLFVNPFSDKVQEICGLPKKKKLSQWKKLMAEEEKKSTTSSSLRDFLSKL